MLQNMALGMEQLIIPLGESHTVLVVTCLAEKCGTLPMKRKDGLSDGVMLSLRALGNEVYIYLIIT